MASEKIEKILEEIGSLTLLEAKELADEFEEKFGVTRRYSDGGRYDGRSRRGSGRRGGRKDGIRRRSRGRRFTED